MPLILTVYHYLYNQRESYNRLSGIKPARFLLPAALLSGGTLLSAFTTAEPRSTYVCQSAWYARSIVPITQLMGVILDCFVLIWIDIRIKSQKSDSATDQPYMDSAIVALVLMVSADFKIEPYSRQCD